MTTLDPIRCKSCEAVSGVSSKATHFFNEGLWVSFECDEEKLTALSCERTHTYTILVTISKQRVGFRVQGLGFGSNLRLKIENPPAPKKVLDSMESITWSFLSSLSFQTGHRSLKILLVAQWYPFPRFFSRFPCKVTNTKKRCPSHNVVTVLPST